MLDKQRVRDVEIRFSLKEKFERDARDLECGFALNVPCGRVNDGVYVLYNGNVTHCCADAYEGTVFGNIKDSSLDEILSSSARRFLLESLSRGERWRYASCRDCLKDIEEELYVNSPSLDRDGEILRLGLKKE